MPKRDRLTQEYEAITNERTLSSGIVRSVGRIASDASDEGLRGQGRHIDGYRMMGNRCCSVRILEENLRKDEDAQIILLDQYEQRIQGK